MVKMFISQNHWLTTWRCNMGDKMLQLKQIIMTLLNGLYICIEFLMVFFKYMCMLDPQETILSKETSLTRSTTSVSYQSQSLMIFKSLFPIITKGNVRMKNKYYLVFLDDQCVCNFGR